MFALQIENTRLKVRSDLPNIEFFFKRRFSRFYSSDSTASQGTLYIQSASSVPSEVASIRPQCTWHRALPLWGELKGNTFYLTDGFSMATVDGNSLSCTYHVHPSSLQNEPFFYRSFLLIPLLELLKFFGFYYVHGSLVTKNNRGLLFLGAGGTGKSTFSATLVGQGWQWISDDNMLLWQDDGQCKLTAFEQEFSLHPSVAKAFQVQEPGYLEHGKIRIPHSTLAPDLRSHLGHVSDIVSLEGSAPTLVEEKKSKILQNLLRENPTLVLNPATAAAGFKLYQDLVSRSSTYSIRARWQDIPALTYFWSAV